MGREWNDKVQRTMTRSIGMGLHASGRILITDLTDSPNVLVEVLSQDEKLVIGSFIVRPQSKPKRPRYREPSTRWPA